MIVFRVRYRQLERDVTLYHEWDIEDKNDIIDPRNSMKMLTYRDVRNKFFKLTDGSELYVKILNKTFKAITTEIGIIKILDYCSFCIIRYPYSNYTGVRSPEEHPLARPYRRTEHLMCGQYISQGKAISKKKITPRIKKMLKDKLKEIAENKGIDAEWIIDRVVSEADNPKNKGAERLEALKMLGRMQGVELDKGAVPAVQMNQPLFNFTSNNIQEQRRNQLDESKEIKLDLKKLGLAGVPADILDADIAPDTGSEKRIKTLRGHVK